MKKLVHFLFTISLIIILSSTSCDTENEWGPGLSGSWNCQEESPQVYSRSYKVSIERDDSDTSLYRIYNFYNLGLGIETIARLSDTVLTLLPISSDYNVVGTGHVNRMLNEILWEYSISGINVNDQNVQARYLRR